PMTPQQIRDKIKTQYPEFYGTESHKRNVEKGHYQSIDHALLAQIYTLVRTNDSFFCDQSTRPMKVSLINDNDIEEPVSVLEDFQSVEGVVYVLRTNTFTKDRNGQKQPKSPPKSARNPIDSKKALT